MNHAGRLEWTNHRLKFCDQSSFTPRDHIDAIDQNTLNFDLELKYGVTLSMNFADIDEAILKKHLKSRAEVFTGNTLADLRGVNYWRTGHGVFIK